MKEDGKIVASGQILEEQASLSVEQMCRTCRISDEMLIDMVEHGILEVEGPDPRRWRFTGTCIKRVHLVLRLQRDLGLDVTGAAIAVDLLEEIESLRARLRILERFGFGA